MTKKITCLLILSLLTSSTLAVADDSDLHGQVAMQGSIIVQACTISTGDNYQAIEMIPQSRSYMKRAGIGLPNYFSIHLLDCSFAEAEQTGPWNSIRITFDGSDDQGLFQVGGSTNGVALQLTDKKGDVYHPGQGMAYSNITVLPNDIRLDYELRLQTNQQAMQVGEYFTTIKYRIDYF